MCRGACASFWNGGVLPPGDNVGGGCQRAECEPPLSICRFQWLDMRDCMPGDEKQERDETRLERLIQALEEDRLDSEGAQSRLLDTFQPIQFSADILDLLEDFTGREWVFDEGMRG